VTAFLIADIKVTHDKWIPEYAASVHEIVHKHGGGKRSACKNVGRRSLDTSLIAIVAFHPQNARPLPILGYAPRPRRAGR
jgi:uncharacterized protein (DUF1330 family)